MREMEDNSTSLVAQTSAIVSAFVGNNAVSSDDLVALIGIVHKALLSANAPDGVATDAPIRLTAAQIRKSITPDALISFEDGRAYSTLKRHLTKHGMTVVEYKAKWGLPNDYPTTAPSYSAKRSEMAKAHGLGRSLAGTRAKAKAATPPSPTRRGRSKSPTPDAS